MFLYLHFYALTAAFSQDRITEIRFIFPCQKTKTIRKNMKLWFQTLNNRQCRTVISEREETKKRNPMIAPPTYYLDRDYRPHPRKGESRQRSMVMLGCRDEFGSSRTI